MMIQIMVWLIIASQFASIVDAYFRGRDGTESDDWDEAKAYCEGQGSHLATIKTVAEFNAANSVCQGNNGGVVDCWIGIKRDDTIANGGSGSDKYMNIDGTIANGFGFYDDGTIANGGSGLTPWGSGQPDGDHDCVGIHSGLGYYDQNCSRHMHPLCDDVFRGLPVGPYFALTSEVDWNTAISNCESYGTQLAIIQDEAAFNAAKQVCAKTADDKCWLGLKDIANGVWVNIDNTHANEYGFDDAIIISAEGWATNEPNYNGQFPCLLLKSGGFADSGCDKLKIPLCSNVVRLVDGLGGNEGRLEVYYNDEWGTVCGHSFDKTDAQIVCKQLGFIGGGDVLSPKQVTDGTGTIIVSNVECKGYESSLTECSAVWGNVGQDICTHEDDVGIRCNNVRLMDGKSSFEGRVEIYN
eukprot:424134_1